MTSGVSISSLGRVGSPQSDPFPINRRAMGAEKGFRHWVVKEIKRNKREEEERRGNEVEALSNRDCGQSLHHSLFGVLRATVG